MKKLMKYLLILLGCLILNSTHLAAEYRTTCSGSGISQPATEQPGEDKTLINAQKDELPMVGENNPFAPLVRVTSNPRSPVRISARNSQFNFSFGKNLLLQSEIKDSLLRVYIQNCSFNLFIPLFPPCRYYVFALRKMLD
ncbi:MAG: hypothetical protein LBR64_05945 [Dysgonamonadaceae bacterium]|jgi:hypothetical protein|nr:hypothetical protein [Dysgonamonadaceae bacterium]